MDDEPTTIPDDDDIALADEIDQIAESEGLTPHVVPFSPAGASSFSM